MLFLSGAEIRIKENLALNKKIREPAVHPKLMSKR